jgi:hypothetical protein
LPGEKLILLVDALAGSNDNQNTNNSRTLLSNQRLLISFQLISDMLRFSGKWLSFARSREWWGDCGQSRIESEIRNYILSDVRLCRGQSQDSESLRRYELIEGLD